MTGPLALPRGLTTAALLKSRLDAGKDYFDLLVPFAAAAVAESVAEVLDPRAISASILGSTGLSLPLRTISVLLDRLTRVSPPQVRRDSGTYIKLPNAAPYVPPRTPALAAEFDALGTSLVAHCRGRIKDVNNSGDALQLLCAYLDAHGVTLLVESQKAGARLTRASDLVVASFVDKVLSERGEDAVRLEALHQGLVLSRAVTLEELADVERRFSGLTVYFDTPFVLQVIGLYGPLDKAAAQETILALRELGAAAAVFDITVQEVRRVLAVYEWRLDSSDGRRGLDRTPVTRHAFATNATGSDMTMASTLLVETLGRAGVTVHVTPTRIGQWVEDERSLLDALADYRGAGHEDREDHDLNAIAGIMTLRAGRAASRLEDCRAVFASQGRVIGSVMTWWRQTDHTDYPPIIAHSALVNACWVKRPRSSGALLAHELAAVCAATLDPSPEAWGRFRTELKRLVASGQLQDDLAAVILIDGLSARLLVEAEETDSLAPLPVAEIIDRVRIELQRAATEAEAAAQDERERHREELARVTDSNTMALERERDSRRTELENLGEALSLERHNRTALQLSVGKAVALVARALSFLCVAGAVLLVLLTVVFPFFDGPRFSPATRRALQAATVIVSFVGSAFGVSASSLGPWLQRRIERRIRRALGLPEPPRD